VCIFKTPRFVAAPQKTLAQCLRLATVAANLNAAASSLKPTPPATASQPPKPQAFNALLLKDPRFGLTIDELDAALGPELAVASRSGPALSFTTNFLPSDEVLVRAVPILTAAAVATSLAATPQAVESALAGIKASISKTVSRLGLAGAVSLCHVDASSQEITRREGGTAADGGGWNAVASRGAWRKTLNKVSTSAAASASEQRAPSAFVALRKLEVRKKEAAAAAAAAVEDESVEEDWLAAVEKEESAAVDGKEGLDSAVAKEAEDVEDDTGDEKDPAQSQTAVPLGDADVKPTIIKGA
jgi:transcriptional repressor NF-X1